MPSSASACALVSLHSFPTRRSSDLQHQLLDGADGLGGVQPLRAGPRAVHDGVAAVELERILEVVQARAGVLVAGVDDPAVGLEQDRDRKSTRLNSSHVKISYAVFCLSVRSRLSTLFPYTTLFRSPASAA